MKCQQLIDDARLELNDPSEVTWSNGALLDYLSDGLLALANIRPDATAATSSILLAAGTRQSLPSGGLRLMRVTRNMGTNGTTPGRAIHLGDMDAQNDFSPDWHTEAPSAPVLEYFYDMLVPREFFVYPPVPASPAVYIEASFSRIPAVISNPETTDLPVDAIYAPALREWMLYRAWGGDDEQSPSYAEAQGRLATFFKLLGAKSQADIAVSAKEGK